MDIVEVSDVEGSIARFGDRYLRRVFTQREISACDDGSDVRCLATCFAAKEAALKTFGTDVGAVDLRSVEILLDPEPVVTLSGGGARLAVCERISHFSVSVVASAGYAAAVVLAESTAKPLDDHKGS
ncbi:MAG TPA: holo-ACP synthase [Gaiella sp.]|nr:holo-ACP synthase [Gaiella sp.]